jgi:superfamily II DNA helicase RecQ
MHAQVWFDNVAGSGKSLCYQLPALLLGGTTLVVSPLLALMRDQLQRLPPQLPAAMLSGGQSKQEALQVLANLQVTLHKNVFLHVCSTLTLSLLLDLMKDQLQR